MTQAVSVRKKSGQNPVVIMSIIVLIAGFLTYVIPSGKFAREKKLVVPGTYEGISKHFSFLDIFFGTAAPKDADFARPVSLMRLVAAIPEGIIQQADLIFMVMFIGAMFGVLNKAGVIESGLERMLGVTKGNVYVLVPTLMTIFSIGSTCLGMAKEYLLVIPMVIALTNRLGLSKVVGLAIVAVPAKVGYLASLTNPYALAVAQPLVGVPTFSGMWLRLVTYVVMLTIGITFVLLTIRKELNGRRTSDIGFDATPLSRSHVATLLLLAFAVGFMVFAAQRWEWDSPQLSAYYIFWGIIFGIVNHFNPAEIADAMVGGMKKVMIAAVLIGMATAVAVVLQEGMIMDSIINGLESMIGHGNSYIAGYSMFLMQLLLDIAIPSTSGQVAVTMPIMGPLGQLVGVNPNTVVFAFLMGNGLTNIITPTSSGLLIYLAAAEVSWTTWVKYVWKLWVILFVTCLLLMTLAIFVGY